MAMVSNSGVIAIEPLMALIRSCKLLRITDKSTLKCSISWTRTVFKDSLYVKGYLIAAVSTSKLLGSFVSISDAMTVSIFSIVSLSSELPPGSTTDWNDWNSCDVVCKSRLIPEFVCNPKTSGLGTVGISWKNSWKRRFIRYVFNDKACMYFLYLDSFYKIMVVGTKWNTVFFTIIAKQVIRVFYHLRTAENVQNRIQRTSVPIVGHFTTIIAFAYQVLNSIERYFIEFININLKSAMFIKYCSVGFPTRVSTWSCCMEM